MAADRPMSKASRLRAPAVARMSRGDEAARYIRSLIFEGELKPGERVPQDDIASVLGVSRIPVREALITLESEGWVTIELNRGAFVNGYDAHSVRDHYALFGMLYGFSARRALERSDGRELADRLDLILTEAGTEDPTAFTRLTVDFTSAVVRAASSPRLSSATRSLGQLVPGDFFSLVPDAVAGQRKGMRAVARAIRQGDGDKADAAFRKMMRDTGDVVFALFEQRGLMSTSDTPPRVER